METKHDLAKWLSGSMTPEELSAFEKTPEFGSYQKIAAFSAELQAPEFDSGPMLDQILVRPKKRHKAIPIRKWLYPAAALVVLALGCFFFTQEQTVSKLAAAGKKTVFSLPDDSRVTLNSGSEIEYKKWNWPNSRAVKLNGEAFFKVAKGKTFTVRTDLGEVAVLGTQFNVRSRGNRFEVECFEGKVKVHFNGSDRMLPAGNILVLENGKQLAATPTQAQNPSWMQGRMRMVSVGLPNVLKEIERVYAIRIEVNHEIPDRKFTGFLPSDDLRTVLEILANTYGFHYKADAKHNLVLIEK